MAGDNIFAQGMDAFDKSYDRAQTMRDQRTRNRAAPKVATGDFRGAAQEYGAGGMADEARQSVADQQTVDDRGKADQRRNAEMLIKAAEGLKTVPMGQRKAALSHPIFQQIGLGPELTGPITEDQLSDQSLDMFTGHVKQKYQQLFHNPEHGIYGVTPQGGVDTLKAFPRKPLVVPQTSDIFMPEDEPDAGTDALAGGPGADTIGGGSGADALAGGDAPAGYRLARAGRPPQGPAPKERARLASTAEKARYGIPEDVPAQFRPDGSLDVISLPATNREDKGKTFTQEQQLRAQYGNRPQVKDLASVQAHIKTIGSIARKASTGGTVTATDDLALIFAFMKMLDPGSVVREGEFANAQNTAGIPDRIRNLYNRAKNGTRLTNRQREEFFNTATTAMDSYTSGAADQSDSFRALAGRYGLSPDNVAAPISRPKPRTSAGARPAGIPTLSPQDASKLPKGAQFRTTDGRLMTRK